MRTVFVLAILTASAAGAQSVRAPYLQQGTPTSMTVVWRTAAPSASVVCYGASPGALTERAEGPAGLDHVVRIEGLAPATRYAYAAGDLACPAVGDPQDTFTTAPPRGARAPVRAWIVGDSGTGGANQRLVRDAMLAIDRQPEIYLHMGDMAYTNGTTPQFDTRFFAVYREILRHTVVWPAMGNHEGLSSDSGTETGPYYEAYVLPRAGEAGGLPSGTEAYYAFDYANVHFVVLDSHDSSRLPGGPMLSWLEADLAATDQEWIVAFWHHPPYTHGTHNSDVESQLVEMRRYAVPILEAAGVDLVLTGHSHSYERSMLVHGAYDTPTTAAGHVVDPGDGRLDGDGPYFTGPNGAVYVVAGHGGQSLGGRIDHPLMYFSELAFGSCLLDADGARLSLTNLRWDGAETDHVDLVKSDGIYLFAPIGGERVLAGREISILWGTIGGSGRVRVEASLDDGRSWETLAGDLADGGHLRWATPRRLVDRARVRVTDTERRWLRATSRPFSLVADAVEQAISLGGEWEYLDDGAPPPSDWRTATGGWARGPAQLGYGQGDEATRLYDASPNVPTVLFRRAIEIDAEVTAARLHVIYDDGFVAYVDGAEVARENVGDTSLGAFATATTGGDATLDVEIDPTPLTIGAHVIAVAVKQVSATSSDLSFDLSLELDLRATLDPVIDPDAGLPDAGAALDAGLPDASPPIDAGASTDASREDGGAAAPIAGGCGCRATSLAGATNWLVAILLLSSRRSRSGRERSSRPRACTRGARGPRPAERR